jgi:hypothetical protein
MLYAQQIFLKDTKKESWSDAKKEFGVGIDSALRTYADSLKENVRQHEIKDPKNRPRLYYTWIKNLLKRVCIIIFL